MGGCASVPKGLKAEAVAAPAPESPKEETTTAEVPEVSEVKAEEGEKKVDGTGDVEVIKEEEKVAEDNDKHQSLSTLMNDNQGEAKEETLTASAGAEAVPVEAVPPTTTVKVEENMVEESPVYDTPPKKDDAEKPSKDIAEVTKEEKKNEEITQKS